MLLIFQYMNLFDSFKHIKPSIRHMIGWILICILGSSSLLFLILIATDFLSVSGTSQIVTSLALVIMYAVLSAFAIELIYS